MKTPYWILMIFGVLVALSAHSASFSDKCPDLATCATVVGEMLDQKYIFDKGDLKGSAWATPNMELTKDNAELLFTKALDINGFARVPLGQPKTYQIARQRDARDSAIPTVTASYDDEPKLPNNWDLYTMKYQAKNPEIVEWLARTSRSFMPANSRIIPMEASGVLIITDTAANLKKLYDLIKFNDVKPSKEILAKWKEREQDQRSERHREKHDAPPPAKKE